MRLRILVVDDDKFMRDMLPPLLAKGYGGASPPRIDVAGTPEEAEALLAGGEVGEQLVVLSDYNLKATRNGLDLLGVVERKRPDALRILFSGHTREEIGGLDAARLDGFIEKPFRLPDIVPALRTIIEGAASVEARAASSEKATLASAVRTLGRAEMISHLVRATSRGEEARARTLYEEAERRGEHREADRETARALAAQNRVLELVAKGAPLDNILNVLTLAIEEQAPEMVASVMLLDAPGKRLLHGAAPRLPDAYNRAIDGIPVGAQGGSCGRAAQEKRVVVVSDTQTDPSWSDYRDLAREHGLASCWSSPILSSEGRVVGTFALYAKEQREPDERELQLLELGSNLAHVAIESHHGREQLHANRERYRTLFNSIDQGFCVIDVAFDESGRPIDYRFIEINAAFEAQTGLKDVEGRWVRSFQPQLEEYWFQTYGKVALTGEPVRFENQAAPMGRWFDVYAFRVGEPEQRRIGVLFSDITQRKRAQAENEQLIVRERQALAETAAARERLRGAISQAPVAMALLRGPEHVFELVNAAYEVISGRPAESVIGRTLREAFPEIGQAFYDIMDNVYRTGEAFVGREIPVTLMRNGGRDETFLDFVYHPSRDAKGTVDGIIVVAHEVTDQVRARMKLETAATERETLLERERDALAQAEAHRARLHALFMQAPAAIGIVDGPDHVFSFVNPRYEELVDLRAKELLGRPVCEALPGVVEQGFIAILDEVRRTGTPFQAESMPIILRKDGRDQKLHLNFVYQPVQGPDGAVTSIMAHAVDVSAQVKAQEETQELAATLEARVKERTRALEETNRDLESFSYVVSHDLRAPLRAVHHLVSVALESIPHELNEAKTCLAAAQQSSEGMARLIDGLLALARATQSDLQLAPVDLTQMAHGVAAELALGQPERQVHVTIQDDVQAHGDPRLLRSVLDNLLGNAWKFTQGRPNARIEFGTTTDPGVYFVRDNGIGFDPARATNLFQPFQRLHNTQGVDGTGIGLATVRRVIERHGGRVWAESQADHGATFYFTLP